MQSGKELSRRKILLTYRYKVAIILLANKEISVGESGQEDGLSTQ